MSLQEAINQRPCFQYCPCVQYRHFGQVSASRWIFSFRQRIDRFDCHQNRPFANPKRVLKQSVFVKPERVVHNPFGKLHQMVSHREHSHFESLQFDVSFPVPTMLPILYRERMDFVWHLTRHDKSEAKSPMKAPSIQKRTTLSSHSKYQHPAINRKPQQPYAI